MLNQCFCAFKYCLNSENKRYLKCLKFVLMAYATCLFKCRYPYIFTACGISASYFVDVNGMKILPCVITSNSSEVLLGL